MNPLDYLRPQLRADKIVTWKPYRHTLALRLTLATGASAVEPDIREVQGQLRSPLDRSTSADYIRE